VEELSQLQRSVANAVVEQKGDRVTKDLPKQSASQVPEIPGPHPLYGVPSGELAEDGVDPVAQVSQEGAPLGRGTALLVPVGREEFDAHAPRQLFLRTMTGLGTSLPPGIEIGEQAVVASGAVVRDS
jgi:hypothetical protein